MSSFHNSNPYFDVTCAIPRTGRTLKNFFNKLKSFDTSNDEIDQILEVLSFSKKKSTSDLREAISFLDAGSNMGFGALLFSVFLPIQNIGGLMVFAMVSTSIGTLTVLAALSELLKHRLIEKEDALR